MDHSPHAWQSPPPPRDLNGWGMYVARTLEHLLVRAHYSERHQEEQRVEILEIKRDQRDLRDHLFARVQMDADTSDVTHHQQPAALRDVVKEVGVTAKEIGTALRWLLGILALVLLATKKLDLAILQHGLKAALTG